MRRRYFLVQLHHLFKFKTMKMVSLLRSWLGPLSKGHLASVLIEGQFNWIMKLLTFSLQWFLIMTCTGIKVKEGTKWKLKRTLLEIQFIISKTTKRKKYVLKLTHEMRQLSCFPLQVCPPPLSCRSCLPWMLSSTVRAPRVFTLGFWWEPHSTRLSQRIREGEQG